MKKKTTPPAIPVLSLDEISGFTADSAADAYGERYSSRSRAFVEMGKFVYHLEHRVKLAKGQTIYGLMSKRNVPESSVNNARLVSKFIENFVVTGLVSEARFNEIATFRVVNQANRIISGKTAAKLTAEQLAPILNEGEKAAIGDELDCLDEHGMTIAGRQESEAARIAEENRITAAKAAAAALAAAAVEPKPEPEPVVVDGTKDTPEPTTTPPVAETGTAAPQAPETPAPAPSTAPVAGPAPAKPASSHESRPASTAEVLAKIAEVELQSYDLDADGLAAVKARLVDWISLIDNTAKAAIAVA